MASFLNLIKLRPVRFVFLVESLLGLIVGFGIDLTVAQVGLLVGAVNAILAFTLESFTTPVDRKSGDALSPDYRKVINDAPDIFPAAR